MNTIKILGLTLTAALALSACASTAEPKPRGIAQFSEDARLGEQVDSICFASRIDNFRATTRDTVIVERGVNTEYLVETFGGCQTLRSASAIGLANRDTCLRRGDNLLVSESLFGNGPMDPQRCSIKAIYEWDEAALEAEEAL